MRTTLTLDEDVAVRLKQEMRRTGRPFKETVNGALRRGLNRRASRKPKRFVVKAHHMGALRPGLSLDNIWKLIEEVEGPRHR